MSNKEEKKDSYKEDKTAYSEIKEEVRDFECDVLNHIQSMRTKTGTYFWRGITLIGSPIPWLALLIICVFIQHYVIVLIIVLTSGSYLLIIIPLKQAFKRKRPKDVCVGISIETLKKRDFSFPSGHTFYSNVNLIVLGLYSGNILLLITLIMLGVLVGFSRLYLGVHYLTDVIMGYLLAIAIAWIIMMLVSFYGIII
jgi:undecaprenyl-diphosphatase